MKPNDVVLSEEWEQRMENSGFWRLVGFELLEASSERSVVSLNIEDKHFNPISVVHGGVLASLIDNAMGIAVKCARPETEHVTTNLNLHYVSSFGPGPIRAVASVLHSTRSTTTVQATVMGEDGKVGTIATASFRALPPS